MVLVGVSPTKVEEHRNKWRVTEQLLLGRPADTCPDKYREHMAVIHYLQRKAHPSVSKSPRKLTL